MFLWVSLIVSTLQDLYSLSDLRNAIEELPDGLDAAYVESITHIILPHVLILTLATAVSLTG